MFGHTVKPSLLDCELIFAHLFIPLSVGLTQSTDMRRGAAPSYNASDCYYAEF